MSCGIVVPPIRIITELVSHNGAYYTIFSVGIWSLDERQFDGQGLADRVGFEPTDGFRRHLVSTEAA